MLKLCCIETGTTLSCSQYVDLRTNLPSDSESSSVGNPVVFALPVCRVAFLLDVFVMVLAAVFVFFHFLFAIIL